MAQLQVTPDASVDGSSTTDPDTTSPELAGSLHFHNTRTIPIINTSNRRENQ